MRGGGGSGGGSTTASNPDPQIKTPTPTPPSTDTPPVADNPPVFQLDGETRPINEKWNELEYNGINFGSVYGAGSVGFGTVSNIKTHFDGEHTLLTVERSNGDNLVFNRSNHDPYFDVEQDGFWDDYYFEAKDYLDVVEYSDYGIVSASRIGTHYNKNDFSDYIGYGYWLVMEIDANGLSAMEIGAFADGPEFGINSEVTSKIGKATYEGDALLGLVYETYSHFMLGDYVGSLDLTADFSDAAGNGTISGNIGKTVGNIALTSFDKISGEQSFDFVESYFYLKLNETDISNGRFIGDNIEVIETIDSTRIFNSEGEYGGQFSDVSNYNRQPSAVTGIISTSWENSYGYLSGVWGSFLGRQTTEGHGDASNATLFPTP